MLTALVIINKNIIVESETGHTEKNEMLIILNSECNMVVRLVKPEGLIQRGYT